MIRILGGEATGNEPRDVAVAVTAGRKPYLPDFPDVHVSVAHTAGVVVVACLSGARLGVDIESVGESACGPRTIVRRRFAELEQARFAALSPKLMAAEFIRYWTVKEAVGKALGIGVMPALRARCSQAMETVCVCWRFRPGRRFTNGRSINCTHPTAMRSSPSRSPRPRSR